MKKSETDVIGARFNVKGSGGKKFLVVGKTDKGLIGNWVDVSDMKDGKTGEGTLKTNSFSGDKKIEVSFSQSKVVKILSTINNKTILRSVRYAPNGERIMSASSAGVAGPDIGNEDGGQSLPP